MAKNTIRTDLATVRRALDVLAECDGSYHAASNRLNLDRRTIQRWYLRSLREPTGWPTPADVEAWRTEREATAEARARTIRKLARYRARKYLCGGRPLMVSSVGTCRRVKALIALGWTGEDIAARVGSSPSAVLKYTGSRASDTMTADRAAVYLAAYRHMHMTAPTHRPAHIHARQRRWAGSRGWAPPLAWASEAAMDDPDARPNWNWVHPSQRPTRQDTAA